jgi:DNA-binding response OmpR family regulator
MSDAPFAPILRVPTIYFIDDSATMREVIKIAFRKESIHVIACHDAASALTLFAESKPDAVITDVIMPDKDGYEVCRFVKQNPELRATPVILMSGVVNRQVAEKAMEAGADELMRKPFQPQELVTRVKNLLNPKPAATATSGATREDYPANAPSASLSNLFAPPAPVPLSPVPMDHDTRFEERRTVVPSPSAASAAIFASPAVANPVPNPAASATPSAELLKLRSEVRRLEMLVKKLQSELQGEKQYCAELESQLRVQQET